MSHGPTPDSSETVDLVALTFLPTGCALRVAERLRRGETPRDVLGALVREHWPDRPASLARLRARASDALARAPRCGAAPIGWIDASYPVALTTIIDPPPLLWTIGAPDVLQM